ncbi:MAG TPA: hypothetical protein EYO72_06800, partial [Marine Group III euryarchaeote]|nr:hypothetical protein [Marine Group III euryarchaeote]
MLLLAAVALLFFSEDVEANEAPTASIDSVTPDPAYQNIPADFKSIDNTTVGYWSFDEGNGTLAYDSTDFGNNGSLSGDVNWVNGWQSDHALSFDGDNDYVTVPDDDSLDMEEDFSIFAWV